MLSVMATRTRPPAEAATRPGISNRLVTVDVFRGLALAFMAVAHCAYLMGVNLVAERFDSDVPFRITSWTEFVLALLGNPCAIMLWSSAGMAIALFERGRRAVESPSARSSRACSHVRSCCSPSRCSSFRRVGGEGARRRLHVRHSLVPRREHDLHGLPAERADGRAARGNARAPRGDARDPAGAAADPAQPHAFWSAVWLHFSREDAAADLVPDPAVAAGDGVGLRPRAVGAARNARTRRAPWRNAALATFALAMVFRFGGAYFNLVPELPLPAWPRLVILCRQPPSLTYLAWNCALAMLMYSGIAALASRAAHGGAGARVPGALLAPLNAIGREPLVFFMTHFAVFQVLTRQAKRFPGGEPGVADAGDREHRDRGAVRDLPRLRAAARALPAQHPALPLASRVRR